MDFLKRSTQRSKPIQLPDRDRDLHREYDTTPLLPSHRRISLPRAPPGKEKGSKKGKNAHTQRGAYVRTPERTQRVNELLRQLKNAMDEYDKEAAKNSEKSALRKSDSSVSSSHGNIIFHGPSRPPRSYSGGATIKPTSVDHTLPSYTSSYDTTSSSPQALPPPQRPFQQSQPSKTNPLKPSGRGLSSDNTRSHSPDKSSRLNSTMPATPSRNKRSKPTPPRPTPISVYDAPTFQSNYEETPANVTPSLSVMLDQPETETISENENLEQEYDYRLNNEFQQTAVDLFDFFTNQQVKDDEKRKVNQQFLDLSRDFLSACNNVGKVIISEKYLPIGQKTIKPVKLGGIIGGDKYIVNSVLFKFAIGNHMFDDEAGAKIAGHELKGLVHIWEIRTRDICLPLQCVVDYLGFRLNAMLKLPINKNTLRVGTGDAGKTMNFDDQILAATMAEIGKRLNLAAHTFKEKNIYLPADAEGHVGTDGKRYLIDLSRVFPPYPQKGAPCGHLYQMFRPELVKKFAKPLCSDTSSGFIDVPAESAAFRQSMNEAQSYLESTLIPLAANTIDLMSVLSWQIGHIGFGKNRLNVGRLLHQHGVNLRLMGMVREKCKTSPAQMILAVEMIARTMKRRLRQLFRQRMESYKLPVETPYLDEFVSFINGFLLQTERREAIMTLAGNYYRKSAPFTGFFEYVLEDDTFDTPHPTNQPPIRALALLIDRLITSLGIQIAPPFVIALAQPKGMEEIFKHGFPRAVITGISEVIKHMNIISHAEGYMLKQFSYFDISVQQLAISKFEQALNSSPLNKVTLRNLAAEYQNMWSREIPSFDKKEMKETGFTLTNKRPLTKYQRQYISHLYQLAIDSDPKDTHTLYQYADYHLEHLDDYEGAEEYFLRSLISDVTHYQAFLDYQLLLDTNMNLEQEADNITTLYQTWAQARQLAVIHPDMKRLQKQDKVIK